MSKIAIRLLRALGLMIALFGVAVDWLWPDASPGINLPQLVLIVTGLALAFGARKLRLHELRSRLAGRAVGCAAKMAFVTILTLLALELILVISGWSTYFPNELHEANVTIAPWWTCDEMGCRYQYEAAIHACEVALMSGRHCKVNRQGFSDSKDFVVGDDFSVKTRILLLGDSFTQGFSADIGSSFAEILETKLPDAIVWNGAITSTGTTQAVATLAGLAPVFKPQLTVLGFYMNDFWDNLVPLNGQLQLQDSDGRLHFIRRHYVDNWGNARLLPLDTVYGYISAGSRPPASEAERIIGLTRLGSLSIRFVDRLSQFSRHDALDYQIQLTREHLSRLKEASKRHDSLLLVLLIPDRDKGGAQDARYTAAIELMEELNLAHVNLAPMLDAELDYMRPPDLHWNNAGHKKVGALLADCVSALVEGFDFTECDRVIIP